MAPCTWMNPLYLCSEIHVFSFLFDMSISLFLKCIWLSCCLIFLVDSQMSAQRFTGKIIAGINGAQIDGDNFSGFNRAGLLAGVGAAFKIDEHWSIGPEFLYSGKGSQVTLDQVNELGLPPWKYKLRYIEIPVIAGYKVRDRFGALAGLSFNYFISGEIDNGSNAEPYDASPYFKRMDYQFLAGLEYEIFDDIWLQGRWAYSIVSVNKGDLTTIGISNVIGPRGGMFNNVLQFSLRYNLKFQE